MNKYIYIYKYTIYYIIDIYRLCSYIFIYLHNFPSKFPIISCLPTLGRPNLHKTVLRHVQVLQKWEETSSTVPQVVQTLGSIQDISSFLTMHLDSKVRNAFSSFQCISASSYIQSCLCWFWFMSVRWFTKIN